MSSCLSRSNINIDICTDLILFSRILSQFLSSYDIRIISRIMIYELAYKISVQQLEYERCC